MSFNRIEAYVSSESEEEVDTQVTKKRAAKRDRLWNIEKTFPNSKEAFEFLETEKTCTVNKLCCWQHILCTIQHIRSVLLEVTQ
jgi:hypothetical protein